MNGEMDLYSGPYITPQQTLSPTPSFPIKLRWARLLVKLASCQEVHVHSG